MSEEILRGKIKWFRQEKGFGFIEVINGQDVFVHSSQISGDMKEGDEVEFRIKEGKKGPIATEVKKVA